MTDDLDLILSGASACRREAIRRDAGEPADARFDVPLAMLADLGEETQRQHGVDLGVVTAEGPLSFREFLERGAHVDADGVVRPGPWAGAS